MRLRCDSWPGIPTLQPRRRVLAGGAFGLGTVAFDTWLKVVFLKRLREVAAGEMAMPTESSVAGRKGMGRGPSADRLFDLISRVDELVEDVGGTDRHGPALA